MHHDNLSDTLISRRKSLCVTQELLSELSEVGLRTIKKLESGKGNPTLNTVIRVADVLGLELRLEVKGINPEQ